MSAPPRPPAQPVLPRPPGELASGTCIHHPRPDIWASNDPADRAEALAACRDCPALVPCLNWSLHLLPDRLIYGGLSSAARARLAAARQTALDAVMRPAGGSPA
jgi:hypothetical protein